MNFPTTFRKPLKIYRLQQPCEGCEAPYGYKNHMTLDTNTKQFAVSERNQLVLYHRCSCWIIKDVTQDRDVDFWMGHPCSHKTLNLLDRIQNYLLFFCAFNCCLLLIINVDFILR